MLEKQDIEMIRSIMQSALNESEERITEKFDGKLQNFEERITKKFDGKLRNFEERITEKFDQKLRETEKGIFEEMDRMRESLEEKIANVDKRVDNLETYYRITKLENDNTSILLKLVEDLQNRVTILKKKIA